MQIATIQRIAGSVHSCSNWCSTTATRQQQQMARLHEQQPISGVTLSNALIEKHNNIVQYVWCCKSNLHGFVAIIFSTKDNHIILQPTRHARLCTDCVSKVLVTCGTSHSTTVRADLCGLPQPVSALRTGAQQHLHKMHNKTGQQEWQTCVVLPQPVSPQRTTTSLCSKASMTSCSMPVMGSPLRTASMSGWRST